MKKIYKNTILSVYENQDNVVNPTFLKCRINILDTSSVANHTHFKKENVNKSIYQLDYLPVRGLYKEDEEEFGGHEISYYIDDEGNLKESVGTVPMGVVINNSARWENINNKETLVCDCYIWTNNNEGAVKRIKENCVSQSMEINIDNYSETNKDYIEIEDFTFTALTLIDTQPAFNCGSIRTYSKNDFEADYKHMIEALNKYLNYEKGGEEINMDENKELNTNSQEEFEKDEKSCKKNCEDEKAEDKEIKEEEDFSFKKKKKCEEEDSENKMNELESNYSSLKTKYSELETSNNELKSKYEVLLEEVTLLRQYKADKEEAYRQSEEARIFSQFESLKGNEKFDKLVSESRNYELEELEEKCFAIYGMVSKAKAKPNKKEEKKPIVDKVYSEESVNTVDKLSATFEKYLNK